MLRTGHHSCPGPHRHPPSAVTTLSRPRHQRPKPLVTQREAIVRKKKKRTSAAASPEITQQWRGPRGPLACDQLCGETEARKGTELNPSQ